eukprot:59272-Chlamydomonas_euryale.AAC.9
MPQMRVRLEFASALGRATAAPPATRCGVQGCLSLRDPAFVGAVPAFCSGDGRCCVGASETAVAVAGRARPAWRPSMAGACIAVPRSAWQARPASAPTDGRLGKPHIGHTDQRAC